MGPHVVVLVGFGSEGEPREPERPAQTQERRIYLVRVRCDLDLDRAGRDLDDRIAAHDERCGLSTVDVVIEMADPAVHRQDRPAVGLADIRNPPVEIHDGLAGFLLHVRLERRAADENRREQGDAMAAASRRESSGEADCDERLPRRRRHRWGTSSYRKCAWTWTLPRPGGSGG